MSSHTETVEELTGRELDGAIERLLQAGRELRLSKIPGIGYCHTDDGTFVPAFSANIILAWSLVTRLTAMGYRVRVICYDDRCSVGIHPRHDETTLIAEAFGVSAPETISRAALRALIRHEEQK